MSLSHPPLDGEVTGRSAARSLPVHAGPAIALYEATGKSVPGPQGPIMPREGPVAPASINAGGGQAERYGQRM